MAKVNELFKDLPKDTGENVYAEFESSLRPFEDTEEQFCPQLLSLCHDLVETF